MTASSPSARPAEVNQRDESDRVSLNIIADYCREVEKAAKRQHDLGRLCENLLQFGEVCGNVLYYSNGINQLTKLSIFFRKRLLKQHLHVVQKILIYLERNGAPINDHTFFLNLAQEIDSKSWENSVTYSEQQTRLLRHKARRLYMTALPSYNACISKMYPDVKQGEEDSTRYRIIKVGVDYPAKEVKKQNAKRNVKDIEKKFEMRSRFVKTTRQTGFGRHSSSRNKQSRSHRVRVGPTYSSSSLPLTHENLNEHVRYAKEVGVQDRDPLSWPYDPYLFRETPFEGRRALSDGGFEMEKRDCRINGRALSDDGGPIYQGSEDLYRPTSEFNSYEADSFISTPKFDSPKEELGYYCRFTPSPPPPSRNVQADDVLTLTDNGFFGSPNVWRSVFKT